MTIILIILVLSLVGYGIIRFSQTMDEAYSLFGGPSLRESTYAEDRPCLEQAISRIRSQNLPADHYIYVVTPSGKYLEVYANRAVHRIAGTVEAEIYF